MDSRQTSRTNLTWQWFRIALQIKESVAIAILPRVLLFIILSLVVSYGHAIGYWIKPEVLGNLVGNVACNLVLGLLLVFRTNTAYDRYWEGRRAWGTFTISIRNLAREIKVGIKELNPADKLQKEGIFHLLIAFVLVTKQHLRDENDPREIEPYVTKNEALQLNNSPHRPLLIITWLSNYLHHQFQNDRFIDPVHLLMMTNLLNDLVSALTSCERIRNTSVPPAYIIYLKRLLLIYCAALPFFLVSNMGWWTPVVVGIITFVLFGVEEIGTEIEDPFGHDPNDLPIELICRTVRHNVTEIKDLDNDYHKLFGAAKYSPDHD
jgi:putative membrane protein